MKKTPKRKRSAKKSKKPGPTAQRLKIENPGPALDRLLHVPPRSR